MKRNQGVIGAWQKIQQNNLIMISNKPVTKIFTTRSNKKTVRRVQTEADEQQQIPYRKSQLSNRDSQTYKSKPKYLDVYSKLNLKDSSNPRKTFKINTNRHQFLNKYIKTEPDEGSLKGTSDASTMVVNKFEIDGIAGKGTFGTVYIGHTKGTGQKVAIKKVLQDKRYKNRELEILKLLKNQNVLQMRDFYLSYEGEKQYLNVVMDFFPYNLHQTIKKKILNPILIKIYMFQILKGLNYLATLSIAHRDIKPQNILVDVSKNKAVICDFGSAKQLVKGEPNLAYICSRCYRAPELIFGATDYTHQIDMWSTGCVLVQMINGNPPFLGDSQIDQLIEIIKILGTPSKEDVLSMNKNYDIKQYQNIPKVKKTQWKSVLQTSDPPLIDLVHKMLQYSPKKRITAAQAIMHPFFDQLRNEQTFKEITAKYKIVPDLFEFSKQQLKNFEDSASVVPAWVESKYNMSNLSKMNKIMVKRPVHRLV